MKCEICKAKLGETFLGKIEGTHIRDKKRKKRVVCRNCQKALSVEEILEKLD